MRIIVVASLCIATVILCLFLTGCSSRYDSGHDQLFQLSDRHVIYRDLTVPASMGNLPEKQEITSPGIEP
ncbi:hypothetical protein L0N55_004659 [Salmonella enterica]|uniref:hypothetical protein n=1 Tax=Enterobacteriaceae TaxID=543 RepID=UPI000BDEDA9A|nr:MULTISPECIES: hypothetical protein [Enterobacteriaceae]EAR9639709.1 hypothetical protein [Salmonella enterica]EHZ3036175.1 hypothetical protein [Salmonella enterica subsp. enterica serovar Oranienburg]EEO5744100.1 hypothetical protein [Salmonella enterica]EGX9661168.1 hypothetical protein [Salmonella enterica]EHT8772973.1 hypothetical protein [Salmonella enterica]